MAGLAGAPCEGQAGAHLTADEIAERLAHWGFLAHPDLPDAPGPAFLLVALRPVPTLEHFDPEAVDYWVSEGGHGERRTLTGVSRMPISETFSWGTIRLTDRLRVTNEYLTFGGRLDAASFGGVVMAAFTSPVPLLRRGGHSQGLDPAADMVGAFFGRLMVAVDYLPGFEAALAEARPTTRYAAFVHDRLARIRAGATVDATEDAVPALIRGEARRLATADPEAWQAGAELLAASAVTDDRTPAPAR
jgi:hypothetical protein